MTGKLTVVVTGAGGQIGYSLVPMICAGCATGSEYKLTVNLLEVPQAKANLESFNMELTDSAFPLVEKINLCYEAEVAFKDADLIFLVGAFPRGPGMDRADLLKKNAQIFKEQGKAIEKAAKKTCKILVVGNPANTNARIVQEYCPSIPKENITSMMRLDYNRAKGQICEKTGCLPTDIKGVYVWGNHSNSQVPDVDNATIKGTPVREVIKDDQWIDVTYMDIVAKRGAAVIAARGKSSAASAAWAACNHMHDWVCGTEEIIAMGVPSTGAYGIPEGVIYSYPVTCKGGKYHIVEGLNISDKVKAKMMASYKELVDEREVAIPYCQTLQ